jgi:hypothetical protein
MKGMTNQKQYLGDDVYAMFDGYSINLLAQADEQITDIVSLQPEVLSAFLSYVEELKAFIEKAKGESHE